MELSDKAEAKKRGEIERKREGRKEGGWVGGWVDEKE